MVKQFTVIAKVLVLGLVCIRIQVQVLCYLR